MTSVTKKDVSLATRLEEIFEKYSKSAYHITALAILAYKQKNKLISPMEIAIRERFYFDFVIEVFLKEGGDPSDFFNTYWGSSPDDNENRTIVRKLFHLKCANDSARQVLSKFKYMDLSSKEMICSLHLQKIAKLLPPEKEALIFLEPIVLYISEFDDTIGVYIKDNEEELRKYWGLRNKQGVEAYWIFRSMMTVMKCDVEFQHVLFDQRKMLQSITINPIKHVQCFDFNTGVQKFDILKEDKL